MLYFFLQDPLRVDIRVPYKNRTSSEKTRVLHSVQTEVFNVPVLRVPSEDTDTYLCLNVKSMRHSCVHHCPALEVNGIFFERYSVVYLSWVARVPYRNIKFLFRIGVIFSELVSL